MVRLVEHIGRHNPVEEAQIGRGPAPVEHAGGEGGERISGGIEAHPCQGCLFVVGGRDRKPGPGRHEAGEAQAAAELQERLATAIGVGQILGQHDRRFPDVGPVGNPLVVLEGDQVDQRLHIGRPPHREASAVDIDAPFDRREAFKFHS